MRAATRHFDEPHFRCHVDKLGRNVRFVDIRWFWAFINGLQLFLLNLIAGRETCPLVADPPHEHKPYVVFRLGEKITQVLEINAIFTRNFSLKLSAELFTGVLDLVSEANLDPLEKQLPEKILRCVRPQVRLF